MADTSLIDQIRRDPTFRAAIKDKPTATEQGEIVEFLDGVRLRPAPPIVDIRGSVFEVFRTSWDFDDHPVDQIYITTLRPKVVKGWGLHLGHDDRYFLLSGEMQVVLYDARPYSPTHGKKQVVHLTEENRQLLRIPLGVWHADYNPGQTDAMTLNMPTVPYDYENPDKYRLPIDTDLIPHDFPPGTIGG